MNSFFLGVAKIAGIVLVLAILLMIVQRYQVKYALSSYRYALTEDLSTGYRAPPANPWKTVGDVLSILFLVLPAIVTILASRSYLKANWKEKKPLWKAFWLSSTVFPLLAIGGGIALMNAFINEEIVINGMLILFVCSSLVVGVSAFVNKRTYVRLARA